MNHPIRSSAFCLLTVCCFLAACCAARTASAQQNRTLILSPDVGSNIDNSERDAIVLFGEVSDFHSASLFVDADDGPWFTLTRRTGGDERLPLSPNTTGLKRPRFPSVILGLSAGILFPRVADLEPLIGNTFRTVAFFGMDLTVPLWEYPDLSMMLGVDGGFEKGNSLLFSPNSVTSFSVVALWRPETIGGVRPLIGAGVGHGLWQFENSEVEIEAAFTYPVIVAGASMIENCLDLVLRIPLRDVSANYESQTYTISPAGPSLSIRFTLD